MTESPNLTKRILLVEDYPALANMTKWALEMDDHEVIVAENGISAMQLAKSHAPDIILMDIGIPGMDGYATCKAMRKEPLLRNTFIVALTGWGQAEHRQRSKEAGFDEHLVKPVDIEVMRNLVLSAHRAIETSAI